MYQVPMDKLIDFTERHAEQIALEWCTNVRINPRTPSYHSLPEPKLIMQAVSFYQNLRNQLSSKNTFETMSAFASKYAEDSQAEGIPLCETIYALLMMRRHIWLFAEFQLLFTTALDMFQAIESINRVVLLTDYAVYAITKKYQEK